MSQVAFYILMTYFTTATGTITVADHQVMIQMYGMCVVWGEPFSQTAQSFMPELLYGTKRSSEKARMLLKSLVIIGAILGVLVASIGAFIPWLFPFIFTSDLNVAQELVSRRGYGLPGR
ncbi:protein DETOXIFICATION 46, chloroplastic-like [Populus nigra]|uniref:protein DETOXIFICATION 46, chloroplastic-like n=1 Tax=Populus nigra TaxID=3691 RepID=UPI002B27C1E0|nr:protein DETOXIFICATION 46, chloroplastic-like [Populus nigra]XP_061957694.1 protein DETOXIFICATION 46, chloroplastic-like [Populus nigra]